MTNMRIKQNQRYACTSSQRPLRKEGAPVSPVPVWRGARHSSEPAHSYYPYSYHYAWLTARISAFARCPCTNLVVRSRCSSVRHAANCTKWRACGRRGAVWIRDALVGIPLGTARGRRGEEAGRRGGGEAKRRRGGEAARRGSGEAEVQAFCSNSMIIEKRRKKLAMSVSTSPE